MPSSAVDPRSSILPLVGMAIFATAVLVLLASPTFGVSCPVDPPPPDCDNGGEFPGGRWDLSQVTGTHSLSGRERFYPFLDDPELYDDYDVEGELSVTMLGGSEENYLDVGCDGTVTGQGRERVTGTITKTPDIFYYNPDTCISVPRVMDWTLTLERTYSITGTVTGTGQLDLDLAVDEATLDFSGTLTASEDCSFIGGSDSFDGFDVSGDVEKVRFAGPIDLASFTYSPTLSPREARTWVDDILHRVMLNQEDDGSEDSITVDPTLAGPGPQSLPQPYNLYFIQDAITLEDDVTAMAEPKTPTVTALSLDEPSQYLQDVMILTSATAEIDWRGQEPGEVEFTYGATTETVTGAETVVWDFDAGESGATIQAVAI